MPRLSSIDRIVLGLVSLAVSVLLACGLFGLIPNPDLTEQRDRRVFCESTAVSFMAMAPRMEMAMMKELLQQISARHPEITSVGVRRKSGELVLHTGSHPYEWKSTGQTPIDEREFIVPITANAESWGQLEIAFEPISGSILGIHLRSDFTLAFAVGISLLFSFSLYLRKVLKHISPGKVVPPRVREALNALAEGLLVLDNKQTIVLANGSFAEAVGADADSLIGTHPKRFGFCFPEDSGQKEFPWDATAQSSKPTQGTLLTLGSGNELRTFSVSTVPVKDDKDQSRGVVASFEDVTQLERKQAELRDALSSLKKSSDEIQTQNRELEWLATRDTLTGCLNRRSFFRDFETEWTASHDENRPLSAVMVDIDHFKAINDNHGHGRGDEVLRDVAAAMMKTVDQTHLVCRYGGEEFIVLMPKTSIDEAELVAEKCRLAIKALEFPDLKVTASLGVSAICQKPDSPQTLLDQADKCLYVAKRNGRNKVIRWDKAQQQIASLGDEAAPTREEEAQKQDASAIPFHAVAALTTALAHRDQSTAVHSRRVADLCVATGEGLLSLRECYILEIAALLHDIGKIGIPDAVLRKPGQLTAEEREIVQRYSQMSVDMVRGSFGQPVLTEIVQQHVVWFDQSNADRISDSSGKPSLSARILAIADAYDTMTSDSSYRRPLTKSEAFAELRTCATTQFDPELVERFIGAVKLRQHIHADKSVTQESALSIGLLLEKLVSALDQQDIEGLAHLATRLQMTAEQHGIDKIANLAAALSETLKQDQDMIEIMQMAGELLDLCRSTQSTLIAAESRSLVEC